jgi:hypothetical protein
MAQDYAKVLRGLEPGFDVIGRSAASADKFEVISNVEVRQGGLSAVLAGHWSPEQAIPLQDCTHRQKRC